MLHDQGQVDLGELSQSVRQADSVGPRAIVCQCQVPDVVGDPELAGELRPGWRGLVDGSREFCGIYRADVRDVVASPAAQLSRFVIRRRGLRLSIVGTVGSVRCMWGMVCSLGHETPGAWERVIPSC